MKSTKLAPPLILATCLLYAACGQPDESNYPTGQIRSMLSSLDVYLSVIELEEPTELSSILESDGEKLQTRSYGSYDGTVTVGTVLNKDTNSARISISKGGGLPCDWTMFSHRK